MKYNSAIKILYSLHKFGIKLGLSNIQNLCRYLNNPQKFYKTIHIAGSNGKGSTASFIASILTEHGFNVGLYTSPHFVRFNERIKINGKEISNKYITEFINKHHAYIIENKPTFFELTTAMAFEYFRDNKVDYAVIETGLGGRLDATNIINSKVSVITSISLEHTNILGNTLSKIAIEKAGIIKKNSKVFIGMLSDRPKREIIRCSDELNSESFLLRDHLIINKNDLSIDKRINLNKSDVPLSGKHQYYNASLAILTLLNTVKKINAGKVITGVRNVIKNTGISGRYEVYHSDPTVIFDSAHNDEGIKVFLQQFKKEKFRKKYLIFGAMHDKSINNMLKNLAVHFDYILLTTINYERAASVKQLLDSANDLNKVTKVVKHSDKYITNFINRNNKKDCLVILGSMYLLGEVKGKLLKKST